MYISVLQLRGSAGWVGLPLEEKETMVEWAPSRAAASWMVIPKGDPSPAKLTEVQYAAKSWNDRFAMGSAC